MASNANNRTDATKVSIWMRNYSYSNAETDLYNLTLIYLTDLDKLAYKDGHPDLKNGELRKLLEDGSGENNIPEDSVLFADANGRATFNENLLWDQTGERISCVNGVDLGNGFVISSTAEYVEITNGGNDIGFRMYK